MLAISISWITEHVKYCDAGRTAVCGSCPYYLLCPYDKLVKLPVPDIRFNL